MRSERVVIDLYTSDSRHCGRDFIFVRAHTSDSNLYPEEVPVSARYDVCTGKTCLAPENFTAENTADTKGERVNGDW